MFRKLSIASLLVLALGAQAQKKVATLPFCSTPVPEASTCLVASTAAGAANTITCGGNNIAASTINPASLTAPSATHLSPLLPGTCAAPGARIGVWQATCAADIYEPIVRTLAVANPAPANAAAFQTLCNANVPTAAQAGTNNALCSTMLSVTQNTATKAISKLGSSTWYNYQPAVTYTAVGGLLNQAFAAGAATSVYCIYWPSHAAVLGRSGGGTNKLAKPVINTVSSASAFTNAPAGTTGFIDQVGAAASTTAALTALLLRPAFQETITVNYFKPYLPATQL